MRGVLPHARHAAPQYRQYPEIVHAITALQGALAHAVWTRTILSPDSISTRWCLALPNHRTESYLEPSVWDPGTADVVVPHTPRLPGT